MKFNEKKKWVLALEILNLSNGKQCVQLENVMSDPGFVNCGVPPGRILGPLLFLIHVNDMASSIHPECKLILYAGESAMLFSYKSPSLLWSLSYMHKKLITGCVFFMWTSFILKC